MDEAGDGGTVGAKCTGAIPASRWGASIAMSWLWGLGLSVGMATTAATGLAGLAGLVAIDAGGLWFFGHVMGRRGRDPGAAFAALLARHAPVFALVQVLAISITAYVVAALVFAPLMGATMGWGLAALVTAAALAWSARADAERIAEGHGPAMALLLVGAALAAGSAYASKAGTAPRVLALPPLGQALTPGFVLGFMVGPWLDAQQWRRASRIHATGGSVRRAYALGGLGFALVLSACALAVGPFVGVSPDFDQRALLAAPRAAAAGIAVGGPLGVAGWIMVGVAILATSIDSAADAIAWAAGLMVPAPMRRTHATDGAPVGGPDARRGGEEAAVALVLGASLATVATFAALGASPIWLVLPFMTLLLGTGMLIWGSAVGRPLRGQAPCTLAIGVPATAMMAAGYAMGDAALVAGGPLLAAAGAFVRCGDVAVAAGALAARAARLNGARKGAPASAPEASKTGASTADASPDDAVPRGAEIVTLVPAAPARGRHGHWEGDTYVVEIKTTYDDTNSTGNVYFANYVRFVGKAREHMLSEAFPGFDVKVAPFVILTKNFTHEFRREVREFEVIEVRLRWSRLDRRFATISHEIVGPGGERVGRGSQDIMFVGAGSKRLIDVPQPFLDGFAGRMPERRVPSRPMGPMEEPVRIAAE